MLMEILNVHVQTELREEFYLDLGSGLEHPVSHFGIVKSH